MSVVRRALSGLLLVAAACAPAGPRAVVLNEDQCGFCRMEVTDERFASEAVTRTGKVNVFDSIECLAGYARGVDRETLQGLWVTDADQPGTWVAVEDAGFLRESSLRGPMGQTVAFASPEAARTAQASYGGTLTTWREILADTATAAHGGH